jgi:hypothetical protein
LGSSGGVRQRERGRGEGGGGGGGGCRKAAAGARRPPRLWRCSAPAQDRFHRLQEPSATACPPTRGEAARRVSSSPHSRTRGTRRVTLLGGATAAVYLPQARCCGAGRTWAGACRAGGAGTAPSQHSTARRPPRRPPVLLPKARGPANEPEWRRWKPVAQCNQHPVPPHLRGSAAERERRAATWWEEAGAEQPPAA